MLERRRDYASGRVRYFAGTGAPEHYEFESYDNRERWASYWYQIRSALSLKPTSVLSIGTGNSVFESYLRNRDVLVATVDIDETRKPDYLADVTKLDEQLPEGLHFDVVAAFQVLEHVPFESFERHKVAEQAFARLRSRDALGRACVGI